jgi:hypothetical protein
MKEMSGIRIPHFHENRLSSREKRHGNFFENTKHFERLSVSFQIIHEQPVQISKISEYAIARDSRRHRNLFYVSSSKH